MGTEDEVPVPGLDLNAEARGSLLLTLVVDGEVFDVRTGQDGGTDYDWVSGLNEGYGFGSSAGPGTSEADHRESIRGFLSMIDPATGYIADD